MTVTFFGHGDAPESVRGTLYQALLELICKEGADHFLVGTQGNFDRLALLTLKFLKKQYPHLTYTVVFAYMPKKKQEFYHEIETILPFEVVGVPPRFAIERRNNYMLDQSDVLVTYVVRSYGGAAKFKEKAISKGKRVIELSELRGTLNET